ncbi:flagellar hook-length control protein FliK [uncultured Cohaesibacter sp.]|uniref:flagellar hook-length control protein FliK n=1 Tax=uncultured Cohaesibacter sp. TaxID=1002546 RepID=UPI0029C73062|nr:flagellar hook-length control protein FliK [uncultured Cohaesibacter sp.]
MTDQSISAALRMNPGPRVASGGNKGQSSGQNSRQDNLMQDAGEAETSDASSAVADKSSKDGGKSSAQADAPDFDALLRSLNSKDGASSDAAQTKAGSIDVSDLVGQSGDDAEMPADKLLAQLIKGLEASGKQDQLVDTQGAAQAKGQDLTGPALMMSQMMAGKSTDEAANVTGEQQAGKSGNLLSDQASKLAQMPGTVSDGDFTPGKTGLFDAYSVETKSVSAFDKIVPVVKEAVLTPSQKALRDGFTVLRQETHFAPTATVDTSSMATANTVFQQIGTAIANDLAPAGQAKPDSAASSSSSQQTNTGGFRVTSGGDALKVLDIQLHPADLGRVRLSIRLNDTNVDVRVEVTNASTAKILEGNKQLLDQLLSKAGYRADHISIVAIDEKSGSQITPPSSSNSAHNQANQQGQPGSFSGQGGDAQQGRGEQQQGPNANGEYQDMSVDASHIASDEVSNEHNSSSYAKGITL